MKKHLWFTSPFLMLVIANCSQLTTTDGTVISSSTPIVIGQATATTQPDFSAGLNQPQHAIKVGAKLIVADWGNSRVLIWNSFPTTFMQPADVVLGASTPTTVTNVTATPTASTLNGPYSVASDGTKLFVADYGNNRVLIWNAIPVTSGVAADVVLGQADKVSGDANEGATVTAQSLSSPTHVFVSAGKLYVTDTGNNRIVVWNTIPTADHVAANFALGQADLTSGDANRGATVDDNTLSGPGSVVVVAGRLYVADAVNCRVLGWNSVPAADGVSADFAIGQADLQSSACAATAAGLSQPWGVTSDGTNLIVSDATNHRAMIYVPIPTADGASASYVIGQSTLTASTLNQGGIVSATSLYTPGNVWFSGGKLLIADTNNNRVLIWDSLPFANNTPADNVVGQVGLNKSSVNQTLAGVTATSLSSPYSVNVDTTHVYVADAADNRVLIYDSLPTEDGPAASVAVGQVNLTSGVANFGGVSASTLSGPQYAYSNGTKLFVADSLNNRVLIWNTIPTASGTAANVVVGQALKTTNSAARTATTLSNPTSVITVGTKLIVADTGNSRILIWNTIPTADGAAANVVMGAADKTSAPAGGTPTKEFTPASISSNGTKLFVTDAPNYRVLVWNTIPTTDYAAASSALGQPDLTTVTYPGTATLGHLSAPSGMVSYSGKFFMADASFNRVLEWSSLTGSSGQSATNFFGQTVATASAEGGYVATAVSQPHGMCVVGNWIGIADTYHHRVLFTPITNFN